MLPVLSGTGTVLTGPLLLGRLPLYGGLLLLGMLLLLLLASTMMFHALARAKASALAGCAWSTR